MRARVEQTIDRLLPMLLVVCLLVLAIHTIVEHDVWWQLATGQWILAHGIPSTDPFSYATPDQPWIEMRWLYCVAIELIRSAFGLNALIVGKAVTLAVSFAVLWWSVPRRRWWAASFGVACATAIANLRFQVRPELVSYLLLPVLLACLYRFKWGGDRRWLYALPVVQVFWTNAHTLFALGPVTMWIFVLSEWAAAWVPFGPFRSDPTRLNGAGLRFAAAIAAASSAACLVNPYFLRGALFPFQLFNQIKEGNVLDDLIEELHSPFESAGLSYLFVSYLVVAAASAVTFWVARRRTSLSVLAIWGAYLYLSALAVRNLALFGIVAGFAIAANLSHADEAGELRGRFALAIPWATRVAALLFVLVMVPAVATDAFYRRSNATWRFGFGVAENLFPIRAMAFVRRERLPVPVLNSLGDGGYVLFEGGPKSVFVDGRLEVYGGNTIRDAINLLTTGEGVDAVADRLGVSTVVLRHRNEAGLLQVLAKSPSWAPVYFDETHVVFVRVTPATVDAVARLRIDWQHPVRRDVAVSPDLDPPDWLGGLWPKVEIARDQVSLGQLFASLGSLGEAQRQFEEAIARDPAEKTANLYLGILYRAAGREAEAAARLERAGSGALERADVQALAGTISEQGGNAQAALDAYQRAVTLGDRSLDTYLGLSRTALATNRSDVARSSLLEVVRLAPDNVAAWNNLGILSRRAGAPDDALRYFEASLRVNPNQPAVLNQIGTVKLQAGDAGAARAAFTRALAIDPSYQPARDGLAAVSSASGP